MNHNSDLVDDLIAISQSNTREGLSDDLRISASERLDGIIDRITEWRKDG